MRRATLVLAASLAGFGAPALAAAGPADRTRLNQVLAVLRVLPSQASAACLDSMRDVHQAEHRTGSDPSEVEFAYQNATQICGVDAARSCREQRADRMQAACAALDRQAAP